MGHRLALAAEILRGKSLPRALVNIRVSRTRVQGEGIDLGSKDGSASQYRFLEICGEVKFTDLIPGRSDVEPIDLQRQFPIADDSQDFLLLFNVLEHLYDYRVCLAESFRVLKPGGVLVGSVPFLFMIHPDPDDHFRFTGSTLTRLFSEAGFAPVSVDPVGSGPVTASAHMILGLVPTRPLRMITAITASLLDGVLGMITRKDWSAVYPLAYFFLVEKPRG